MYEDVEPRTPEEGAFLKALYELFPHLDIWPHETRDGQPWLCVSCSFIEDGVVQDTLRLDFDGSSIVGGRSPASLNWDDGVRAWDAGIDTGPPDGLEISNTSAEALAKAAAQWFTKHAAQWWTSERRARWHPS